MGIQTYRKHCLVSCITVEIQACRKHCLVSCNTNSMRILACGEKGLSGVL